MCNRLFASKFASVFIMIVCTVPGRLLQANEARTVVWKSRALTDAERVQVDTDDGTFVGPLARKSQLDGGRVYYFRVRQQSDAGPMSDWSPWHQPIKTE